MLQSKLKLLIDSPASSEIAEPILQPRRGDRPWRIKDLEALADDEASYELVRGDLYMMTPANTLHGFYASRIVAAILLHADQNDLGRVFTAEAGFILQPEPEAVVRAPDVAFVRKERFPQPEQQEGFWPLAPDLVVEIISPSESAESVQEKVIDYLRAGTQIIWLVYPKLKSVVEHRPGLIRQFTQKDSLSGGTILPGFTLPVMQLFRP